MKIFCAHLNTSHLEVYARVKNCCLCCLVLDYFRLLADIRLLHVFVRAKHFRLIKINRHEIVRIAHFTILLTIFRKILNINLRS